MAITHNDVQVTWPTGVNSKSVAAGASQDSEEVTVHATAIEGELHLKGDNDGTPASGDAIRFFLLPTGGDPDGAGTDEFDTPGHAQFLAKLDTNDEDPAILTVPISTAFKKFKVRAVNDSAGRAITVSCGYTEVRG